MCILPTLGDQNKNPLNQQQVPQHHHKQPAQQQQQVPQQGQHQQRQQLDRQRVQDKEHIKEHLEGMIDKDPKDMTEQELQFHYFKQHDLNNDNKLDGIELVNALTHFHTEDPNAVPPSFQEYELVNLIDDILREDDRNYDGYIDYAEFIKSQAGGGPGNRPDNL